MGFFLSSCLAVLLPACAEHGAQKFTIIAGGDCLLDRYNGESKRLLYPDKRWETLKKACQGSDAFLCNLETTVGQAGLPKDKRFVFRAPIGALKPLLAFPNPTVSLANNHSLDYGPSGLIATIDALDKAKIGHAGGGKTVGEAEEEIRLDWQTDCVSILSFGFDEDSSSYSDGAGGCIASLNSGAMTERVSRCAEKSAATIVMLHWGIEYDTMFNGYQQTIARELINAGADLIIGTGPHVLQGIELYRGSLICFSSGNLIFDDLANDETTASMIVRMTLMKSSEGITKRFDILPLRTRNAFDGPSCPSATDAQNILANIAKRSSDSVTLAKKPKYDKEGLPWFHILSQ